MTRVRESGMRVGRRREAVERERGKEKEREREREREKERNLLLCPRARDAPSEQYAVAARNEKVDASAVG
jgi:hypothetical protein